MKKIAFQKLSWESFAQDVVACCIKVQEQEVEIDMVVSISRGGMVAARIVSDMLALPVAHMSMTSYQDMKKQKKPVLTEPITLPLFGKHVLVVDEVSDTGDTFIEALAHIGLYAPVSVHTMSPYIKPHTAHTPDFFLLTIDAWIIFPYELQETFTSFLSLLGSSEEAVRKMREVGFSQWEIDAIKETK